MKKRNETMKMNIQTNNRTPTLLKIFLIGSVLLLMLACNIPNAISTSLPTHTPNPLPTLTPEPSPTPKTALPGTSKPLATVANCYLGAWELKDISGLVKALLAGQKIQNVQFSGSSGSLTLTFTKDGKMTFAANQFISTYTARISILPINLDAIINGSGSSDYSLDDQNSLLVANPDFGAIVISAKAASIELLPPTQLKQLIPVLQGDLTGQTVNLGSTCKGNVMTFNTGIADVPPLTFTRAAQ
jgi:hypothetical protein